MPDFKPKSITLVHGILAEGECAKFAAEADAAVCVAEGRPSLAAGKTNARAFLKRGIVPTVICDNMAGFLFYKGWVKELVLACQYADKTGALCDCGALIYAVLAKKHKVPVRLVPGGPRSRFLGDPREVLTFEGKATAPKGASGYVPLVEWVPAKYL